MITDKSGYPFAGVTNAQQRALAVACNLYGTETAALSGWLTEIWRTK